MANIILGLDVFYWIQHHRHVAWQPMTVTLNINKAYDNVAWDYLQVIMSKMFFPTFFIRLIHWCMQLVKFQILLNSAPTKPFFPHWGIC